MQRITNKVALVTGGASGLGAAIARRLVQEGAQVILADIQRESGSALAAQLNCTFTHLDVTSEKQWTEVIDGIEGRHGALHVLVNNAGIEGRFDTSNPEDTVLTDWQSIHKVNVEGTFLGCRSAIPALRRSAGGAIVNISSTAALVATPDFVAYGASKAAVHHLTKSVALHCARNGSKVRCNSLHPGVVLTPMLHRIVADTARRRSITTDEVEREFLSAIPQGEFVEPEEIAAAVLFLVSDEARHITGATLVVDGGATLRR